MNIPEQFFQNPRPPHAEHLLIRMDLFVMTKLIRFGEGYTQNAQEQADEFKLLGKELMASAVHKDIRIINKNLDVLKIAYNLAMN
jgi:hypothetical protein